MTQKQFAREVTAIFEDAGILESKKAPVAQGKTPSLLAASDPLVALEDAIRFEDEEIDVLKARIVELEEKHGIKELKAERKAHKKAREKAMADLRNAVKERRGQA